MKIFAFFLPQFHSIPENNEWWGENFTEWTNVKNAKPLFKGHKTIAPLNSYYYNLLDESTVKWQNDLIHEYGIDGFAYYHYYFEGKLLLEKPAENLLKNKSIDQKFFFCWANHSWIRSWEGKQTILVEQTYGGEESWEKHFLYLLPFFKDDRYEKKDNKPLFMLFSPFFKGKNEMMAYFDKRCREEGFNGIAVIDSVMNLYSEQYLEYSKNPQSPLEYTLYREPGFAITLYDHKHRFIHFLRRIKAILNKKFHLTKYIMTYDGDKICQESLKKEMNPKNELRSLFFEWDNTPRHKTRGQIINPISKKTFEQIMDKSAEQDYLFVNAWNEWCEGMVLEPTDKNGYKYLEWIKEWREKHSI